jgi:hypothetical protein
MDTCVRLLRPPIAFLLPHSPFPLMPHFRQQYSLFADRRSQLPRDFARSVIVQPSCPQQLDPTALEYPIPYSPGPSLCHPYLSAPPLFPHPPLPSHQQIQAVPTPLPPILVCSPLPLTDQPHNFTRATTTDAPSHPFLLPTRFPAASRTFLMRRTHRRPLAATASMSVHSPSTCQDVSQCPVHTLHSPVPCLSNLLWNSS